MSHLGHHHGSDDESYSYSSDDDYTGHGYGSDEDYGSRQPILQTPMVAAAAPSVMSIAVALANPIKANLEAAGLLELPPIETLTLHINQKVPLGVLLAQKDGGAKLRLRNGNGFTATYSNSDHNSAESRALGNIDVLCGRVKAKLEHNAGTPLLLTVNAVPLAKGHNAADLMSASKEAPHGKLSFVLHGSGAEETFDRGLTDQQLAYVNAFPLSVCNSVQDMAYPNPRHKDKMHVVVGTPVHYKYNNEKEIIDAKKQIVKADELGTGIGDRAVVERVMKQVEEGKANQIAPCDLTNLERMELVLSMPQENVRVSETQDGRLEQGSLTAYMRSHVGAGKQDAAAVRNMYLQLRGTITLPYFKGLQRE